MFFERHITVPANTLETSPLITEMEMKIGVIHYFEAIPWGYAIDMLKCRVERGLHSIFPTNGSPYISFNGIPVAGRVNYKIDGPPTTLRIISWNDSTLYPHSFTMRLWLLPEDILAPIGSIYEQFKVWFEGLIHPREYSEIPLAVPPPPEEWLV